MRDNRHDVQGQRKVTRLATHGVQDKHSVNVQSNLARPIYNNVKAMKYIHVSDDSSKITFTMFI